MAKADAKPESQQADRAGKNVPDTCRLQVDGGQPEGCTEALSANHR